MIYRPKKWHLFHFLLVGSVICNASEKPRISSLEAKANKELNRLVVRYDVADPDSDLLTIRFQVSSNGGESFMLETNDAVGDLGSDISPGANKEIYWNYPSHIHDIENYVIRLIADDKTLPDAWSVASTINATEMETIINMLEGPRNYLELQGMTNIENAQQYFSEGTGGSSDLGMIQKEFEIPGGYGSNFVFKIRGTEKATETILVGAHYDTVEGSPGADDNATGIAAILACLNKLSDWNFKKSIHFVLFDQEESGLLGSHHWVNHEIELYERIEVMINADMIGYYANEPGTQYFPEELRSVFPEAYETISEDDFVGDFLLITSDEKSMTYGQRYHQISSELLPDFQTVSITVPPYAMTSTFTSGDHASFWNANIPAIHIGDGANTRNPNYHGSDDVVATLNFNRLTKATQSLLLAIASFAEIENSQSVIQPVTIEVQ